MAVRVVHVLLLVDDRVEGPVVAGHVVQRVRLRVRAVPEVVLGPLHVVGVPARAGDNLSLEHTVDDRAEHGAVPVTDQLALVQVGRVHLDWAPVRAMDL